MGKGFSENYERYPWNFNILVCQTNLDLPHYYKILHLFYYYHFLGNYCGIKICFLGQRLPFLNLYICCFPKNLLPSGKFKYGLHHSKSNKFKWGVQCQNIPWLQWSNWLENILLCFKTVLGRWIWEGQRWPLFSLHIFSSCNIIT